MNKRALTLFGVVMALATAGLATEAPASAAPPPWAGGPACPGPAAKGTARCHAWAIPQAKKTTSRGKGGKNNQAGTLVGGMSPDTIKRAYRFPTSLSAGAGQTIAIVDAYDAPNAEKDLAVFSSQFGLPSCTTANGCFTKVDQTGGKSYPTADPRWALEISLDIQWAHAIAPGAKILLIEAKSSDFSDLTVAESYANAHSGYVSNSWGGGEFSNQTDYDKFFGGPTVSTFVAAGDSGDTPDYPSTSPNVISVGGTTLYQAAGGWVDSVWYRGGGGCSAIEKPSAAQLAFPGYQQSNCNGFRATPDVALVADPSTGVPVYDSTPYNGTSGWYVMGGTSASAPMWAARAAVSGQHVDASYVYGNSIAFRDVTDGVNGMTNGATCLVGFDLCAGRGVWTN